MKRVMVGIHTRNPRKAFLCPRKHERQGLEDFGDGKRVGVNAPVPERFTVTLGDYERN